MKTLSQWHESHLDLGKFLSIGDLVDDEIADYFLCVLPPACMSGGIIQIGEPNSHVNGRATFATVQKTAEGWAYRGNCYRGQTTEPVQLPGIYAEVKAAGGYISNHESDLYIEDTAENRAILDKYPVEKSNAKRFKNEVTGKACLDIPFAFIPFWEARYAVKS